MTRIYPDFAYSDGPRAGCWWDQTCSLPMRAPLSEDRHCDVAIIGGGFTGISSALHLAQAGVDAVVLEQHFVGWGASGRNGGFCCLGGGMLEDPELSKKFGPDGPKAWYQYQVDAVNLVDGLITRFGIDVDRHSDGETQLAHRPRDMEALRAKVDDLAKTYGIEAKLTEAKDLRSEGLNAGFHGALTIPIGFGLNPQKYLTGLATAAEIAGAQIYHDTPVMGIMRKAGAYVVNTPTGTVTAEKVIIATNGYSSENLPPWFAGRYMPTQSTIIVSRPMTQTELEAQAWTSRQASYDTRHLLHYFRLMPDNRMLFGVRGGLMATPGSEARAVKRARADFENMFPAWKQVETPHSWSGMVCLARDRMPFVGPIPDEPGMYASMCYHGNGVAMASYCGALLAGMVQDRELQQPYPCVINRPLAKFELGRFRRAILPFAYAAFSLSDR